MTLVVVYRVRQKMTQHLKCDYSATLVKFLRQIVYACLAGFCQLMCCFVWNVCDLRARAPLTSRLNKDFGPLPLIVCLFLPSDFLLLDVAPLLSLMHVYGTIYLRTLPPHRLCLYYFKQQLQILIPSLLPLSYLLTVAPLCGPWSSCLLLKPR